VEDAGTHLKVGDKVEALVINIDRKARSIQLSIKAKDNVETQEAMQKLASDNSAATGTTSAGRTAESQVRQQGLIPRR
jgi:small subunit ribosomal protein S1